MPNTKLVVTAFAGIILFILAGGGVGSLPGHSIIFIAAAANIGGALYFLARHAAARDRAQARHAA